MLRIVSENPGAQKNMKPEPIPHISEAQRQTAKKTESLGNNKISIIMRPPSAYILIQDLVRIIVNYSFTIYLQTTIAYANAKIMFCLHYMSYYSCSISQLCTAVACLHNTNLSTELPKSCENLDVSWLISLDTTNQDCRWVSLLAVFIMSLLSVRLIHFHNIQIWKLKVDLTWVVDGSMTNKHTC